MHAIIENEGIRARPVQCCYLCGGAVEPLYHGLRDRLFAAPGVWNFMRCVQCGLIALDPLPLPDEIGKLYTDYYTHDAAPSAAHHLALVIAAAAFGYDDLPMTRRERSIAWLGKRIGPIREMAGAYILWLPASARSHIVDVGSGSGHFLSRMRALGWGVSGVDPDAAAVEAARTHYNILTYHDTLEAAAFAADTIPVLTMSHVIEHLPDPVVTLRECRRVLRPGGRLVIVTPNTASIGRRRFGARWYAWDPPRHLHLFTLRTLRACAERAGLRVMTVRTTARAAHAIWHASARIAPCRAVRPGERAGRLAPSRVSGAMIQLIEYEASRVAPVAEEIVLIATKPVSETGAERSRHPPSLRDT